MTSAIQALPISLIQKNESGKRSHAGGFDSFMEGFVNKFSFIILDLTLCFQSGFTAVGAFNAHK